MRRRGITAVAWAIGLMALVANVVAEPAMTRVFGQDDADERIGTVIEQVDTPTEAEAPEAPVDGPQA